MTLTLQSLKDLIATLAKLVKAGIITKEEARSTMTKEEEKK
jgi:hypothetical protein